MEDQVSSQPAFTTGMPLQLPVLAEESLLSLPTVSLELQRCISMNSYTEDSQEQNDLNPCVLSWGRSDLGCLLRKDAKDEKDGLSSYQREGQAVISISSNVYHTAAVTASGELFVCGQNDQGQVSSDGSVEVYEKPHLVEMVGGQSVASVSCGLNHTVCVTATGCAISFGANDCGQLGHSAQKIRQVAPKAVNFALARNKAALIIKKVVCGDLFTLFLTTTGEVYGCGSASFLGNTIKPTNLNVNQAERIEALVGCNVVDLTAGSAHAFCLTSTGEVYGWGNNTHCELGFESPSTDEVKHIQMPTLIPLPIEVGKVVGMAAGYSHSLLWTDHGVLLGTGSNKYGQLGGNFPRLCAFEQIMLSSSCIMASCGFNHSLALCSGEEGTTPKVYAFGANNFNQVEAMSTASMVRNPVEVTKSLSTTWQVSKVLYIAAGGDQSFVIGVKDVSQNSQSLLKRQFSTLASKAVLPMSSVSLDALLRRAMEEASTQQSIAMALNTFCEIFSSPSLLAGSFMDINPVVDERLKSVAFNVEGVETCYGRLMQLGTLAIARLVGAVQQTITELERATSDSTLILPESSVKVLLILWQAPIMSNTMMSSDLMIRLLALAFRHKQHLVDLIVSFVPSHLFGSRLLRPLHEHLNFWLQQVQHNNQTQHAGNSNQDVAVLKVFKICEAFSWLQQANEKKNRFVSPEYFYNNAISSLQDAILVKDNMAWRQFHQVNKAGIAANLSPGPYFFSSYPYLISAEAKRRMVMAEAIFQQRAAQNQAVAHGLLSGAGVIMPWFVIPIEREHLLHQALLHIASASQLDFKKPLKVVFIGEEGVDEGGVRKEFFQLLTTQLLDAKYGMFTPSAHGRVLWLNMQNTWSTDEFSLVGSMLALALYNDVLLDIHFPKVIYKKLLGQTVGLEDLAELDPEMYQGLKKLLTHSPAEEVEYVYCRNFVAEWDEFGLKRSHPLIEGGEEIAVTGDNRQLYVDKLVQWLLVDSIATQFQALYEGFTRVIPPFQLLLLIPEELELMMVGTPHLDFRDLEQHTVYIGDSDWNASNPTIQWFWETIHAMTFEDKQRFLLFVTGCNKAPIGGLKNIGLKIQRMGPDSESLPTAHTCFNTLLLPQYSSLAKLSERLHKAIRECEGFGLK